MTELCTETVNDELLMATYNNSRSNRSTRRQTSQPKKICAKEERNASIKKVTLILQKSTDERSIEEVQLLKECSETVEEVQSRWRKRDEAKRRLKEYEEPEEVLQQKCEILAQAIAQSQHLVVYTGAGISTAARIPDYRGPNGIWTRLQQGKDIGDHDLSLAEPTYTHMALSELYRLNILKHVVSQNCDGLHLRSGLPKTALSELHGNMYIEVCKTCMPTREYWRPFDVTENTARFSHKTMRKCYMCNGPLVDSIVHFGERGSLQWPLNWSGACKNAKKATTILCLGSSLKVLKKYPWLWQMDKPAKKRPNLYIVNLQWTPKDDCANIKINGKCDRVMEIVMKLLGIDVPSYNKKTDPIFAHAIALCDLEMHTTKQPFLKADNKLGENDSSDKMETSDKQDCVTADLDHLKDSHILSPPQQLDCDTPSNSCNTSNTNQELCFSSRIINGSNEVSQKSQENSFSINSILQKKSKPTNLDNTNVNFISQNAIADPFFNYSNNQFLYQNYQSFITYYKISNSLLHSQFFGYSDLLYYPYQTSLMYSGLHNIINPALKREPDFIKKEEAELVTNDKMNIACEFCNKHFHSGTCMYYAKIEPVFIKQEFRFSKVESIDKPNICVCCDYSTDEEDTSDVNDNATNMCDVDDESEKAEKEQKLKIQAGWFGKGYRKNRKLKRKQQAGGL